MIGEEAPISNQILMLHTMNRYFANSIFEISYAEILRSGCGNGIYEIQFSVKNNEDKMFLTFLADKDKSIFQSRLFFNKACNCGKATTSSSFVIKAPVPIDCLIDTDYVDKRIKILSTIKENQNLIMDLIHSNNEVKDHAFTIELDNSSISRYPRIENSDWKATIIQNKKENKYLFFHNKSQMFNISK